MQRMLKFSAALLNIFLYTGNLHASDLQAEDFLKRFHQDPKKVIQELPPEVKEGKVISRGSLNYEALDKKLIQAKDDLRNEIIRNSIPQFGNWSAYLQNDDPAALIDTEPNRNIVDLDQKGVSKHEIDHYLWSDSYWPIQKGLLGARYHDSQFPNSKDWSVNYGYSMSRPASMIIFSGDTEAINNLSPGEKYDLLVGDSNMGLTNFSWRAGEKYFNDSGFVPGWVGICHGWSAATHMQAPIPFGSITLQTPNGTPITFFQSDVKALTSMLWANASPPSRFIGSKCRTEAPPADGSGRTQSPECLDNNAGTFFTVITNQLGLNNRSFVMDATFDAEVWNYSVTSYKSTYFNPQTLRTSDNLNAAIIPVERFTIDKFRTFRSPETRFVAGVIMDVKFLNEVNASHGVQTEPGYKTYRYIMDLELDANKNVLGGEWYTQSHPDFLWTYAKDARAMTRAEAGLNSSEWTPGSPMPATWSAAAERASKNGAPLAAIVQRIVEAAPKAESNP